MLAEQAVRAALEDYETRQREKSLLGQEETTMSFHFPRLLRANFRFGRMRTAF